MTDTRFECDIATFLINLDRSAERLEHMTAQLNNIGLAFERIRAVDGMELRLNVDDADDLCIDFEYWRKYHHRDMLASEIGCYLSHLCALKKFRASPNKFALILEDDAELSADIIEILRSITANADWDIVKLLASHPGIQIPRAQLTKGAFLVSYVTRTARATAYMVTREAVDRLLDQLYPIRLPYDHVFDRNFEHGLKVRGVNPMPVSTGKMKSTINETRQKFNGPLRSWGDPPLHRRWRVPLIRGWHESRRLACNLISDGGAAALLSAPKKKAD